MILDAIVIGLVVLFALIGLLRGFIKSIVSFFKGATGTIIAAVCAKPVSSVLSNFRVNEMIAKLIAGMNLTSNFITSETYATLAESGDVTGTVLAENMTNKVGFFIKTFFSDLFTETAIYTSYEDLCAKFNLAVGTILLVAIAFLLVLLVLNIVLAILVKIFTNAAEQARFGFIDRLLGLAFGALKGAIVIIVLVFIMNVVSLIPVAGTAIQGFVADAKITSMVYEEVSKFIATIIAGIDFNALIQSAFPVAA